MSRNIETTQQNIEPEINEEIHSIWQELEPNEKLATLLGLITLIEEPEELDQVKRVVTPNCLASAELQQQFDSAFPEIIESLGENHRVVQPTKLEIILRMFGRDLSQPISINELKPMFEGKKTRTSVAVSTTLSRLNRKLRPYDLEIRGEVNYRLEKIDHLALDNPDE